MGSVVVVQFITLDGVVEDPDGRGGTGFGGWAMRHGLEWLETGNDETNAPMRAVNARLGCQPTPDLLGVRGPLATPLAGTPASGTAPLRR